MALVNVAVRDPSVGGYRKFNASTDDFQALAMGIGAAPAEASTLVIDQTSAPAVSAAGSAKLYVDGTSNTLKISVNGAAFADVGGGSSTLTVGTTTISSGTNSLVLFQAGGVLQQDAAFSFDSVTEKSITLTRTLDGDYTALNLLNPSAGGSATTQIFLGRALAADGVLVIGYNQTQNRGYLQVAGEGNGDALVIADGGSIGAGTGTTPLTAAFSVGTTAQFQVSSSGIPTVTANANTDVNTGLFLNASAGGSATSQIIIGKTFAADDALVVGYNHTGNYGTIQLVGDNPGDGLVIGDGGRLGVGVAPGVNKLSILGNTGGFIVSGDTYADVVLGRVSTTPTANIIWANTRDASSAKQWAVGMLSGTSDFTFYNDALGQTALKIRQNASSDLLVQYRLGVGSAVTAPATAFELRNSNGAAWLDNASSGSIGLVLGRATGTAANAIIWQDSLTYGANKRWALGLLVDSTNSFIFYNDNAGSESARIQTTNNWSFGTTADAAQVTIDNGATAEPILVLRDSGTTIATFGDGGTVTLAPAGTTKLSVTSTGFGFFGAAVAAQQTSGANLTNNVTAGGTDDTVDNFTDLLVYANDAAAIRNAIYQLSRKLKQCNDALRTYGLLT